MFGGIGWGEIMVVLIVVLIIFGPKRLPEIGRSIGKAIKEFKNTGREIRNDITSSLEEDENEMENKKIGSNITSSERKQG